MIDYETFIIFIKQEILQLALKLIRVNCFNLIMLKQ